MNEFWALVLGSTLAVAGGMLGTLFNYWLTNKSEIKKEKKETYIDILKFCDRLKKVGSGFAQDLSYSDILNFLSKARLYASDEIADEYDHIHQIASKILDAKQKKQENEIQKLQKELNKHLNLISAIMKKELKIESKKSKAILHKKEKE